MITSPNRELLVRVVTRLEQLLDELVFVGAQVAELLITDPVAEHVRPTTDVDAICEVASRTEYFRLGERLKKLGFTEDVMEGAPICRWRAGDDVVDLMPTHEEILDFKGLVPCRHANRKALPAHRPPSNTYCLSPGLPRNQVGGVCEPRGGRLVR